MSNNSTPTPESQAELNSEIVTSNIISTDSDEVSEITIESKSSIKNEKHAKASAKSNLDKEDHDDSDNDEIDEKDKVRDRFAGDDDLSDVDVQALSQNSQLTEEEEEFNFDAVENILVLPDKEFPKFTLAKNKARFLRMVSWFRQKEEWIEVAPLSGVQKLFKQQTKELEEIRANKMDYEMELETGTLTPSQRSYKKDELKMCRVQEKMAVHLISKLQLKIKSGRR